MKGIMFGGKLLQVVLRVFCSVSRAGELTSAVLPLNRLRGGATTYLPAASRVRGGIASAGANWLGNA